MVVVPNVRIHIMAEIEASDLLITNMVDVVKIAAVEIIIAAELVKMVVNGVIIETPKTSRSVAINTTVELEHTTFKITKVATSIVVVVMEAGIVIGISVQIIKNAAVTIAA